MPPRTTRSTRSKGAAPDEASAASTAPSKYALGAASVRPPRLFVLPRKATADARIVTLPHPRYTHRPARFLVCPTTGIYEFTQIASPKTEPRSWLVTGAARPEQTAQTTQTAPAERAAETEKTETATEQATETEAETEAAPADRSFPALTIEDADLFVATAIDPLFLVLPALAASPAAASPSDSPPRPGRGMRMFLTAEDHLDALVELAERAGRAGNDAGDDAGDSTGAQHLAELLRRQPDVVALLTRRLAAVCDTVTVGDDMTTYRLNEDKLLLALLAKAQRMATGDGLPASLEAQFVTKALAAPVQGTRSAATGATGVSGEAGVVGASTPLSTTDSVDSAESATASFASDTSATSAVSASTTATSVAADDAQAAMQASDEVVALQRLRVAFQFLCSRYVPPAVAARLQTLLAAAPSAGGVDFAPLNAYLAKLAALRQAATLARAAAIDYTGGLKRGLDDDHDDERAEKRRRQQEEERRKKAGESRGVRELKKVNVSGMRKMSDFFKKKT